MSVVRPRATLGSIERHSSMGSVIRLITNGGEKQGGLLKKKNGDAKNLTAGHSII